jgi:hypothetical protein
MPVFNSVNEGEAKGVKAQVSDSPESKSEESFKIPSLS